MAMVAIGGNPLIALLGRRLKPDDNRFLADIEVTEAANQAHAVKLSGLFFESPDKQHVAVKLFQFI